MSKVTRNMLIVIVFVLLIFGIVLAIYNYYKTDPIDENLNKENILDDANTGLDNFINDIFDIDNEETSKNNEEKDNKQTTNTETKNENSNDNKDDVIENQITPGEKKAIELVKEEWKKKFGNLNGVSFNNVMIQSDGKYVVSVNDSKTTKVIRWYVVDTATGLVKEQ